MPLKMVSQNWAQSTKLGHRVSIRFLLYFYETLSSACFYFFCPVLSSVQAFNALLKCIEEPPAHVVFILCTTEPHKVLPTITSRCQVFNFRALSISAIVEQLRFVAQKESIAIADEAVRAIARTADGGLRDALQLLDQLSLLGVEITKSHVIELSGSVAESDLVAILQAIKIGNIFGLLQLSR